MGFWDTLGDVQGNILTGGAYGLYKRNKEADQSSEQNYINNLQNQNQQNYQNAMNMGSDLEKKLYGNLATDVGNKAEKYMGQLESNLNKDTAQADLYRQKQDYDVSKANAKAGLSGVDTTAGKLQEGRSASMQANALNEQFKQKALGQYGQAVGATQNAVANLWLGTMGLAVGSQQTPQPMQQKGILSELLSI